jgi:hypothetical protein
MVNQICCCANTGVRHNSSLYVGWINECFHEPKEEAGCLPDKERQKPAGLEGGDIVSDEW